MVRSRENGVGPPDQNGAMVLDQFEKFVKDCHSGRTVSTNFLKILKIYLDGEQNFMRSQNCMGARDILDEIIIASK